MPFSRAKDLGLRLRKEASQDDITGLAAELTYRAFLALFPFVIFLAALGGVAVSVFDINNPAQSFIDLFGDRLPADARSILTDQVEGVVESNNVGLLSFGIIGALWAAMGGAGSVIKAMNRAYDVRDGRPFFVQKLLALVITLLGVLAVFIAVGVIFSTQFFRDEIADELGLGSEFRVVVQYASFPVVILAIAAFTALIYRIAPDERLPLRNCTPGAVMFAIGWAALTVGFGFYVRNFGSYNATYGALGGVVVLLFWFYLTNLLLLIGAEFNALGYRAVPDTSFRDLPEYRPEEQPAILAGEQSAGSRAAAAELAEPNRVGVLVGAAAVLIAGVTFIKYSLFRCSHDHESRVESPEPATAVD